MNPITKQALTVLLISFINICQNTYGQRLLVSSIPMAETYKKGEEYWSVEAGMNYHRVDFTFNVEQAYFVAADGRWGLNNYFDLGIHARILIYDDLSRGNLMAYTDFRYQLMGTQNKKWASSFGLAIGFISETEEGIYLSYNIPVYISFHPTYLLTFYLNPKYTNWYNNHFKNLSGRFIGSSYGIRFGKELGFFIEGTYLFKFKQHYAPELNNFYEWKLGWDIIFR